MHILTIPHREGKFFIIYREGMVIISQWRMEEINFLSLCFIWYFIIGLVSYSPPSLYVLAFVFNFFFFKKLLIFFPVQKEG